MARRKNDSTNPTADSTEENTDMTATETETLISVTDELDGAESSVTQDAEVSAETPDSDSADSDSKTEKTPEKPIDLTEFIAAVEAAVETRDPASGTLPDESIPPVTEAFRNLDHLKAKNAGRRHVEEAMRNALNTQDWVAARAHMQLTELALVSATASATKAEKVPTDPKVAFTERYQSHLLALTVILADEAPEGVDVNSLTLTEDQVTQARALVAYNKNEAEDKGDAPESTPVVRNAVKLAAGKAAAGRKPGKANGTPGIRRDVGAHIKSAFADVEAGEFLTVAQIVKHKSDEYGEDAPSAGAVSARLFPTSGKTTVEGIEPGTAADGKIRGATKL